jgi:DNA-binding response OmpR family regulator
MSEDARVEPGSAPGDEGLATAGRVLVVDDSVEIRDLLSVRLGAEGYQVSLAENGQQALEVAAELQPDVIICDLVMPVMGGQEFCRRARKHEDLRSCYIIVLTARDSREDLLQSLSEGADDFFVKPWDAHELLARIRTGMRIRELQRKVLAKDRRDTLA